MPYHYHNAGSVECNGKQDSKQGPAHFCCLEHRVWWRGVISGYIGGRQRPRGSNERKKVVTQRDTRERDRESVVFWSGEWIDKGRFV